MQLFYCIRVRYRIHFAELWKEDNLHYNNLLLSQNQIKKDKLVIWRLSALQIRHTHLSQHHQHSWGVFFIAGATHLPTASQNSTSSLRKQVCLSILFLCSGFLAKLCSNPVPKVPLLKYHKQATMQHVRIISYFKKTCLLSIGCSSFAASWHIFWLPKYRSQLGGMFSSWPCLAAFYHVLYDVCRYFFNCKRKITRFTQSSWTDHLENVFHEDTKF